MFMNAQTLTQELIRRLKTNNNQIDSVRALRWLNLAQDDISIDMDPNHLITQITFSTVANQRNYNLEFEFNKIMSIVDVTTNTPLRQSSEYSIDEFDADYSDTGNPTNFIIYGYEWVKAQPDSAATVNIVSSSASDTTQRVRINGKVDGVDQTELLTLNGTTAETGLKSFSEIYSVVKDSETSGIVIVTANDTGTTEIAKIAPTDLGTEYQPIRLYPIPSDAYVLRARGIRRPRRMKNNEDFPDYPSMYHEGLLFAAEERGHKDLYRPTMAQLAKQKYDEWKLAFRRQHGQRRSRRSAVIRGDQPFSWGIGRLPPENFGNNWD